MQYTPMRTRKGLAFLMIATGKYLTYAEDFYRSACQYLVGQENARLILFTDQPDSVGDWALEDNSLEIVPVRISPYRWPEATLLRYEIFASHWAEINAEIVAYVDADTRIVQTLGVEMLREALGQRSIGLVRHPGYFNRARLFDLLLRTPLGPWERRKKSKAHVPFLRRKRYVCGGVWFGLDRQVRKLCEQLAANVNLDRQQNIIAKHHDESHLNRYKIENDVVLLEPNWAFAAGYRNIEHLKPIIEVIHKPINWVREK